MAEAEIKETVIERLDGVIERLGVAASDSQQKILRLTEAEIMRFPKAVKKQFRIHGYAVSMRKRSDGRYNCSYELRYNRGAVHISASGVTLEKAVQRFIAKLNREAK